MSSPSGQAEQLSRDHYVRVYGDLTAEQLLLALAYADDQAAVARVAHLSLIALGHRGCTQTKVHAAITARRAETPHPDITARAALADAGAEHARQIRAARTQELKAARDRERAPRLDTTGAPL